METTKNKISNNKNRGRGKKTGSNLKMKNSQTFEVASKFDEDDDVPLDDEPELRKWFEDSFDDFVDNEQPDYNQVNAIKMEAKKIFDSETEVYKSKNPKSIKASDHTWLKTVMSRGTVADKIAGFTVLIQDSALFNLSYLNSMISMVKVGKKKECFMVIDTLVDLFLSDLLPPNRKLIPFHLRPFEKLTADKSKRKQMLLMWYFEDELKQSYQHFIYSLNQAAHDSVDANKEKVVSAMYRLLEGNPEKEQMLLSNLVNKLGDPSQAIGSKVIYTLNKLLSTHPNMKKVVMEEVEKLIFRTNIGKRPQYYGICFLSQYRFSQQDSNLALDLIKIYFSMFKACIKLGDVDSRMMGVLLTGVNRAFPFIEAGSSVLNEHISTMFKIVHIAKFNIAVHALSLLYQADPGSNRYYQALYKKLSDPQLATSKCQAVFLSLVYKSLKRDKVLTRIKVFIKRLLQITFHLPVNVVCGLLFIISQVIDEKLKWNELPVQWTPDAFTRLEMLADGDEDECYKDVDVKEETDEAAETADTEELAKPSVVPSWHHASNMKSNKNKSKTNMDARNPLYANSDRCYFQELSLLVRHFHPTVALFSQQILDGKAIKYTGDPLQDFTLLHFLERFCYKNPKKQIEKEEKSEFDFKKNYLPTGVKKLAVNSASYMNQSVTSIPADEMYLFSYLRERKEKLLQKADDSDNESVGSDEFEEMLDGMFKKKEKYKKEVDFADEIGRLQTASSAKKRKAEDDDDDVGDDGDDEIGESNEGAAPDNSGWGSADEFDGDEVDDFGSDDELQGSDIEDEIANSKKGGDSELSKLFASAEEFSELLEKTGSNKYASKYDTRDNASVKQLKWEEQRDHWIRGGKTKRNVKKVFKKKKK